MGGAAAAADLVLDGRMQENEFKFFSGMMTWGPGQLPLEANSGIWITAECSRAVALKQCLGLPLPLWLEVLQLMGGEHGTIAADIIAMKNQKYGS